MYAILKHAHSGLRWVVLLLLLVTIVNAFMKWRGNKSYMEKDRKLSLYALIFVHLQLIIGLILYFQSPLVQFSAETMKNGVLRFYTVEHFTTMLIAIALITVGYSRAKRKMEDAGKFRATFIYYLIGLLLILISIPWPFRFPGAGWF